MIHADPDGVNINNGCGSTHLDQLKAMVKAGGYDLGIAFDGDADRCLMVDEAGEEIDGDQVIAACGLALKEAGELASSRGTRFSGATPPPETASSPRCNSWICSAAPARKPPSW